MNTSWSGTSHPRRPSVGTSMTEINFPVHPTWTDLGFNPPLRVLEKLCKSLCPSEVLVIYYFLGLRNIRLTILKRRSLVHFQLLQTHLLVVQYLLSIAVRLAYYRWNQHSTELQQVMDKKWDSEMRHLVCHVHPANYIWNIIKSSFALFVKEGIRECSSHHDKFKENMEHATVCRLLTVLIRMTVRNLCLFFLIHDIYMLLLDGSQS